MRFEIVITDEKAARVLDSTGVKLDSLDLAGLDALTSDPVVLVDVIYLLCRKQADAVPMSDEQFGALLVGDALGHATDALLAAIAAWLPPFRRDAFRFFVGQLDLHRSIQLAEVEQNL